MIQRSCIVKDKRPAERKPPYIVRPDEYDIGTRYLKRKAQPRNAALALFIETALLFGALAYAIATVW